MLFHNDYKMLDDVMKFCNGCECEHPIDEFAYRNVAEGTLHTQCKAYQNVMASHRVYEHEDTDTKICSACGEELPISIFWYKSKKTGQKEARCGPCIMDTRDPEARREMWNEWYKNGGGQQWVHDYNQRYRPIRNERNKERLRTDPVYKVKKNVRSRISECLKKYDQKRKDKIKYLGTSKYFYHQWLQYQFDNHMNWDNYGSYWEIDHVNPIATFDLTIEDKIYECFDWKNTRPLEKKANKRKSDTVDEKIIRNHRNVVESFLRRMIKKYGEADDNNRYSYYTSRFYGVTKDDYEI